LDKLIEALARFSHHNWIREQALSIHAARAKSWGVILVFHRLWQHLGIEETITERDMRP